MTLPEHRASCSAACSFVLNCVLLCSRPRLSSIILALGGCANIKALPSVFLTILNSSTSGVTSTVLLICVYKKWAHNEEAKLIHSKCFIHTTFLYFLRYELFSPFLVKSRLQRQKAMHTRDHRGSWRWAQWVMSTLNKNTRVSHLPRVNGVESLTQQIWP